MLTEPTMNRLYAMKLNGMAEAYEEQGRSSHMSELSFEERFSLLVDRQWMWKENRALATRLAAAQLKEPACIEDLDYRESRGLKRAQIEPLNSCDWVRHRQNVVITGLTGCGKTYVACALAHRACRCGYRALYFYGPKLFRELSMARADGSLASLLKRIARAQVLVIDDWSLTKITEAEIRELLEILDDRHGAGVTIMTSQLPVDAWHQAIADPTLADAILDRLIHGAHRFELKGESMRKRKSKS